MERIERKVKYGLAWETDGVKPRGFWAGEKGLGSVGGV